MKSAWSVFSDWEAAQRATIDALQKAADAVQEAAKQDAVITELLQKHGSIVHDGYVYWLGCNGRVFRTPCVDSISINLEEDK